MSAMQRPWAILLCRFSDDLNDPSQIRLSDLYAQWNAKYGATWLANNLTTDAANDTRTILDLYNMFFTSAGIGTYNAVKYWDEMSHGTIDVSGSQVFPCKLDMTQDDGSSLYQTLGGFPYQEEIFKRAKTALEQQHGVDWKGFYGVAVSFQSPDYGAQGGWYDGGPGVYMDVRFVRDNGMEAWGQEMGHGFGLDHSRQDGSTDDYKDMWDVMSTRAAFSFVDPNYGSKGPGLNAWNMRSRQWLDENRIWKGQSSGDFSRLVVLRPLHRRDLPGYLGAELPAVAGSSPYLVEFRSQADWDVGIPKPAILVHRFEGPVGQFMGTHSYVMKGTSGQLALSPNGVFATGTGPIARLRVLSIDEANDQATVQLCYSLTAMAPPSVKISPLIRREDSCDVSLVEGSEAQFVFILSHADCAPDYKILWTVSGASPVPGGRTDGKAFSILAPNASTLVTVSVTLIFDDATTVAASYQFHPVPLAEAAFRAFVCRVMDDRPKPIPWWDWDPEKLRTIAARYSRAELQLVKARTEHIANVLGRIVTSQ